MAIKFTKMHGLGNDFMVIDAINQTIALEKKHIQALSNRHTGVGFDQCLLIEASQCAHIDFYYRIFNADGQEVGQCGNGARCLALFAYHHGLTRKKSLTVATKTTQMQLVINNDDTVSVDMGVPKFQPQDIPFRAEAQAAVYELLLADGTKAAVHSLNVGNPHALVLVDDIYKAPVNTLGPQISTHPHFPEQTNTGFMRIISPHHIELRVFERGCGETNACGSGAVAAAAIGQKYYNLAPQVKVSLVGGELMVEWPNKEASIRLTGPAAFVYDATIYDVL